MNLQRRTALLVCIAIVSAALPQSDVPHANPGAIVVDGLTRFTVLTPHLIRMEWAEGGKFEDHASLVFINRYLEVPEFSTYKKGDSLVIQTGKLSLAYKQGSGRFTKDNLRVSLNVAGKEIAWRPGMEDKGNLGGTIRTLDGVEAPVPLEPGLLSRDGWVVIDESERPLFDNSDWPWVMPRPKGERQDLYFFGYGHEYKKALHDFAQIAGRIPMPPRFAFGLWWSRYWAYTDQELKGLVSEFETHDVPLDVLVIDMDWHNTFSLRWDTNKRDQAGQRLGWTGYTWDRNFFPDPPGFLAWCESKGLKTPLNIHPASGIQPHEEKYPEMARAMGIAPETRQYVPFDIVDRKFVENYMSIVLHPLEQQGVDFWWLDWQQWGTTKIPGVTPTWWLNYVFFTDMEREGKARPLLFHRWGGLGNHRYQIGFSGDAISNWDVLKFETYFTATASNVGFGYWSHDIGGHIPGPVSPEMYTRWIQFGAFSPILRTHTTKNPKAERRIWGYPTEYSRIMREAVVLRYSLIPYIYTASRACYESGVSMCRPMYYDHPEQDEAYDFKNQYMFGDDILVAPIVEPTDSLSMLVLKRVWLAEGEWYEWCTGARLSGPRVFTRAFALDEMPLYARAGAVIPMQPNMSNSHEKAVDPLILTIFPGDSGTTRLYEDEGNSLGYKSGEYAWTTVRHSTLRDGGKHIEILPPEGNYPGMRTERAYEIRLPGTWPPEIVLVDGEQIKYDPAGVPGSWWYDGERLSTVVVTGRCKTDKQVEVRTKLPHSFAAKNDLLNEVPGMIAKLRRIMPLINAAWPKEWSPDILVNAAQTGNRIGVNPLNALRELEEFRPKIRQALREIDSLKIDPSIIRRVHSHMADVTGR